MNNDSENDSVYNPYQPTEFVGTTEPITIGGITFPGNMRRGMVGHVQILGVLMIVHGIIDLLAAVFMMAYAWMMPGLMRQIGAGNGAKPMPPQAEWGMLLVMGGIGVVFLIAGVSNLLGGIWAIQFRRRPGVVVGLVAGFAMLLSCYCFPTSLALMIYGMFVMFSQPVIYAFSLRQQGHDVKEIQQSFLELRQYVG
ncbi:hypothetical protein LF1_04300 [Rubripirellula obstinata]|uniref:Uncharacterized protein n=1 Tax=Rubripirellula obstinata TaxID=406547 RepID=A0A5B1CDT9_9BACT|nr:hypothetical protein [Rubripirellula obstinata]KAA1257939.1 hypothetical protein LF1_04300 [Rubripirellula obstinata]